MKQTNKPPGAHAAGRRIAGHAQQDHILDPYSRKRKLEEGTVCPDCGAVFKAGRWQWTSASAGAPEVPCAACQRTKENFPAGIVSLAGEFAREHKEEILRLARHQEDAEKQEHPMNRIMSVEEDRDGFVINTTDIHLPRRIGEAVRRAFHGNLREQFEQDGYFVRVTWRHEE
jgi:NMD protein affecting ribosome stability and mRNA decay